MIEFLPPVDVGDVQLDDRAGKHLQRIQDGQGGEGEGGGVDDDSGALVDRLMDPADDLRLRVRLQELERVMVGGAPLNDEFGRAIGADAYCRDAATAVETAKELVRKAS